jgi:integrase
MGTITDRDMQARTTGKDTWLSEDAPKGQGSFRGRITSTGARLFYFRYTGPDGNRIFLPLGAYDPKGKSGLTLKEARTRAGELSILYQSGVIDLKGHMEAEARRQQVAQEAEIARLEAERQAAEAEAHRIANRRTVEEAARAWLAAPGKRSGKPKSAETTRRFERDVFPTIGSRALEDVTKGDIRTLLASIEARGALVMARHMTADLRQFFDYCVGFDWISASPIASIKRVDVGARANERDRVLTEAEIRALPGKIETAGMFPPSASAIWIMLATCCRIGELSQAKWADVDLEAGTWRIPADNSKNGKEHTVHLSDFAIRHFKAIHAFSGARINDQGEEVPGEWVMPAKHNDGPVCSKSLAKQIGDRQHEGDPMKNRSPLVDALKLPGGKWTPHDLRRTGATLMVGLGVLPEVVERCLNHVEANRVKRIYQRHDYRVEMTDAWRLLGERLDLLTHEDADNILTFKRKTA